MKYLSKTFTILLIITMTGIVSCSDSSTGTDELDSHADAGTGTLHVSGAVQAEHEGHSWYIGLRSEEGGFINLMLHIDEQPPLSESTSLFGMSVRFVGQEGPFELTTGEYEIGTGSGVILTASYENSIVSDERLSYGSTPEASGTVTILSVSDESITASFTISLEAGPGTDSGMVTLTGELHAECMTANLGLGC